MKSIIEEASSVIKAIEKGWIQAGKPAEFSVKVFEIEQKNFIGMTTKSAKVAVFYDHKIAVQGTAHNEHYEKKPSPQRSHVDRFEVRQDNKLQPKETPIYAKTTTSLQPQKKLLDVPTRKQDQESDFSKKTSEQIVHRDVWAKDMIDAAQHWLTETLRIADLPNTQYSIEVKNYYLRFNFDLPLFTEVENERLFFRSIAHLMMQTLRNKFKKSFRGYKIILNSKIASN